MRPFILQWEAEGLSQRRIVELLNEAGAPVPSEYTGLEVAPTGTRAWSLVQFQRFRKLADEAHEAMKWWATRNGKSHVRPYGDGRGLFKRPELVGLPADLNRRNRATENPHETLRRFRTEEEQRRKDPVYAERKRAARAWLDHYQTEREIGGKRVRKPLVRVGKLELPHPDDLGADTFEKCEG